MQAQLRKRFARGEFEIAQDKIMFVRRGIIGRAGQGRQEQREPRGRTMGSSFGKVSHLLRQRRLCYAEER